MEIIWIFAICLVGALAPSAEAATKREGYRCRNDGCDGKCYKYPPPANLDCKINSGCSMLFDLPDEPVTDSSKNRNLLEGDRQKTSNGDKKWSCWCCKKPEIPSGKCVDEGCSKTFQGQGECVNVTITPWSTIEAKYDLQRVSPYYNRKCKAPAGEENCCLCLKKSSCEDTGCFQKGGICVDMRNSYLASDNTFPRNVVDLNSRIWGDLCRGSSSAATSGEKCCQCYKRKSRPCPPAEIAFVVDRSGSMGTSMGPVWTAVVAWLEALVDVYKIDGIKRKGGLVAWSSKPTVHTASTVRFTDNLTGDQLKDRIGLIPSPGGGTDGAGALDYTYSELFATGSDSTVFREIIFVSDGDSDTPLAPAATQFHDNSIRITAVALGNFDTTQINSMLCTPCGDRFFVNEDFDDLNNDEFLAELADC